MQDVMTNYRRERRREQNICEEEESFDLVEDLIKNFEPEQEIVENNNQTTHRECSPSTKVDSNEKTKSQIDINQSAQFEESIQPLTKRMRRANANTTEKVQHITRQKRQYTRRK